MVELKRVLLLTNRKEIWLLVFFSLLGGHYMVANQEPESFLELLQIKAYYPAMLGSAIIAFIVSFIIYIISSYLDLTIPWIERFKYRFVWQAVSLVLTVGFAFLLASFYFEIRGYSIFDTSYFRQDFPSVVILIGFIHLYYATAYAFKKLRAYIKPPIAEFEDVEEGGLSLVSEQVYKEPLVFIFDEKNVAYFFHKDRTNWAVSFDGEVEATDFLIDELISGLPEPNFFKVQKGFIVNRSNVRSVSSASSRRMIIYLKTPYNKLLTYEEIATEKINCVVIPQRQVKAFVGWWAS